MSVELTPQQIEQLKELEAHHALIQSEIDRAKAAGLNMSDYEQKLAQLEGVRTGLLNVYGGLTRRRRRS